MIKLRLVIEERELDPCQILLLSLYLCDEGYIYSYHMYDKGNTLIAYEREEDKAKTITYH